MKIAGMMPEAAGAGPGGKLETSSQFSVLSSQFREAAFGPPFSWLCEAFEARIWFETGGSVGLVGDEFASWIRVDLEKWNFWVGSGPKGKENLVSYSGTR